MATFLPIDAGANARAAHYALAGVHSLPLAAVAKMQPPGIEPGSPAWQASIIPLDHGCSDETFRHMPNYIQCTFYAIYRA